MVHELKQIPRFDSPVEILRVTTADLAERVNKAARSRQVLPEHLTKDTPLRQYVALADDNRWDGFAALMWNRRLGAPICM